MRLFFRIAILILSFISVLYGGILIAGSCHSASTAGGLVVDIAPITSSFGLILLIVGLWGLIANIKKHRKTLLRGIVIYGILLLIFCVYVRYSSASHIAELYENSEGVDILSPNDFSVVIALISVMILLVYPFFKYENDKNSSEYQ